MNVNMSEIVEASLKDYLPENMKKNNGIDFFNMKYIGKFSSDDLGKINMYVYSNKGPYLYITLNSGEYNHIIVAYKDKKQTVVTPKEEKELLEVLKRNYNGYLFSERAFTRLFNSDMILYYLKSYSVDKEEPSELIDVNIASDYGKLGKMFELNNKNQNMKVLNDILKGEIITATITQQFSLEKYFDQDDFKSLLFYLGMLTIDGTELGDTILKVPNNVIKGLYKI